MVEKHTYLHGMTETDIPYIATGIRIFDDSDSFIWWVFDNQNPKVKEIIETKLSSIAYELTGEYGSYSGPGKPFSDNPFVSSKSNKFHTLVLQRCGMDV